SKPIACPRSPCGHVADPMPLTSAAHPCEKTLVTWSVSRAIGDDGRAGQWLARRLSAVPRTSSVCRPRGVSALNRRSVLPDPYAELASLQEVDRVKSRPCGRFFL